MALEFAVCHCKQCDHLCCTSKNDWIELDSGQQKARDHDFLDLNSLALKSVVDGSPVAPLIQKKDLFNSKETPAPQQRPQISKPNSEVPNNLKPLAPKASSSSIAQAPQASKKGLPPADTELIAKNVAKAMSKPAERATSSSTPTAAPQVPTKVLPPADTELIVSNAAESASKGERERQAAMGIDTLAQSRRRSRYAREQKSQEARIAIVKCLDTEENRTEETNSRVEKENLTANKRKEDINAASKPVERTSSAGSTTPASQASTKASSAGNVGFINSNVAKALFAESETSSRSTPQDLQPPSTKTQQSNGTASGLDPGTKALLDGQRADIDRIMANVDTLMHDIKTVKASMDYLKFQQKTFAEHETALSPTALADDIQTLAKNVTTKASIVEVDNIKKELEALNRRVQHLENTDASGARTANGSAQAAVSALRREKQHQSGPHEQAESTYDCGRIQYNSSSSLLAALSHNSASRRTTTYSPPSEIVGNGHSHQSQSSEQLYAMSSIEDMTRENSPFGFEPPVITSAEKVAAQNRRRLSDSSSSSDTRPPPKKRGRPSKIKGKPSWTTKPVSLNDHKNVLTSDPEDDSYDPNKGTQEFYDARTNDKLYRPHTKRLPTPEWERPDWEGPSINANSMRDRQTARRGVSGRGPLVDRDTIRRRSSGYGNNDYVYFDSPQYWEDQSLMSTRSGSAPNGIEKPRDSQGRLLRPNGKIDGRSLRAKRPNGGVGVKADVRQQNMSLSQAMGLTESNQGQGFVDAAALQAAGYTAAVSPAVQPNGFPKQPSYTDGIQKEADEMDGTADDAGAPATAGAVASNPGDDKHAGLMKQVFPWR
ncbi:MAG: hypothetical protein Q9166_003640 [cf. Caloplaca sp. 2 TL-2023]